MLSDAAPEPAGALVGAFWERPVEEALRAVDSTPAGLSTGEAAARLARYGPNSVAEGRRTDTLSLVVRQFESPIVLILVFATVMSGVLGDVADSLIILAIIVLSGLLGYWQERGASRAVQDLLAVVQVTAEVRRNGAVAEVPLAAIVPGDVVLLNAGDIVPGDCLAIESNALLVDEAALTGETFPAEKSPGVVAAGATPAQRTNALFMGTHVISGSGTAVVMRTGTSTEFGQVSARLRQKPPETGFEQGMTSFGHLLMRTMIVLVVAIFAVNVVLSRPLLDSALFSLALAVGLTPQLLPAIVTISLSQGARAMAREKVIVKRLDAIEDFGAMTILCTDKTGTMTSGSVVLKEAIGPDGKPSAEVLRLAYLNAHLQTGFANPIDDAIVAGRGGGAAVEAAVDSGSAAGRVRSAVSDDRNVRRLAELPYDFSRRRLSVLIADGDRHLLVTKGALENVVAVCTRVETGSATPQDLATALADLRARFTDLSGQGYRVLGVATRDLGAAATLRPTDEAEMTFRGFLTFLDPPKPDAAAALRDLAAAGISVRMITGDNSVVAAHVGGLVGLDHSQVLTGAQLDALDDAALAAAAGRAAIFAEMEPNQKERIIRALRSDGRVVGYLGDGINDAPALHAADVGISVDTAVDVAKESAAIVLLDKDLYVLLDGVRLGRRTFANTMKYVYTTTSANVGNMFSMAGASLFLPFLPLLADQILLINFLTDFPATTIATDDVDPEQLERPQAWDIASVRTFMLVFGLISSAFDFLTFGTLMIVFNADAVRFRSGWFLESVVTELVVLFVLRTHRPFFRSRPSALLAGSSVVLGIVTLGILYSPLGSVIGLGSLPIGLLLALVLITTGYVSATELAKRRFYRRLAT